MEKLVIFIISLGFVGSVFATDNKIYKIPKGEMLCTSYSNVELLYDLIKQDDKEAIDEMFYSKRCVVTQSDFEAYQMSIIGIFARFRFKGTTTHGWGLRRDLETKKKAAKK